MRVSFHSASRPFSVAWTGGLLLLLATFSMSLVLAASLPSGNHVNSGRALNKRSWSSFKNSVSTRFPRLATFFHQIRSVFGSKPISKENSLSTSQNPSFKKDANAPGIPESPSFKKDANAQGIQESPSFKKDANAPGIPESPSFKKDANAQGIQESPSFKKDANAQGIQTSQSFKPDADGQSVTARELDEMLKKYETKPTSKWVHVLTGVGVASMVAGTVVGPVIMAEQGKKSEETNQESLKLQKEQMKLSQQQMGAMVRSTGETSLSPSRNSAIATF